MPPCVLSFNVNDMNSQLKYQVTKRRIRIWRLPTEQEMCGTNFLKPPPLQERLTSIRQRPTATPAQTPTRGSGLQQRSRPQPPPLAKPMRLEKPIKQKAQHQGNDHLGNFGRVRLQSGLGDQCREGVLEGNAGAVNAGQLSSQADRVDCLGLLRSPAGRCDVSLNPLATRFCVLAVWRAGIEDGAGFLVSAAHSSGSKLPRHKSSFV